MYLERAHPAFLTTLVVLVHIWSKLFPIGENREPTRFAHQIQRTPMLGLRKGLSCKLNLIAQQFLFCSAAKKLKLKEMRSEVVYKIMKKKKKMKKK